MYLSKFRDRPEFLLLLTAAAVPLSFATWQALLNNFAIERAAFSGAEMGILQSLREVPGFLAFLVVFLLFLCREQTIAYVSLLLLGVGTLVTGWFPSVIGLYVTTVVMSLGFHYFETVHSSLCLQWVDKDKAPELLGRVIAVGAFTSIVVYGFIWITFEVLAIDFSLVYLLGGGATVVIGFVCWLLFQQFPVTVKQNRQMVLRRRYWLYYALTFLSGARRQIFIVFAGFLMVEKFGFDVATISILFLVNAVLNMLFAARLGRLIGYDCVYSLRVREQRRYSRWSLHHRPFFLCTRDSNSNLFPEDCRSGRYCSHCWRWFYHQSHRSGGIARGVGFPVAYLTVSCFPSGQCAGGSVDAAFIQRARKPLPGKRSSPWPLGIGQGSDSEYRSSELIPLSVVP